MEQKQTQQIVTLAQKVDMKTQKDKKNANNVQKENTAKVKVLQNLLRVKYV